MSLDHRDHIRFCLPYRQIYQAHKENRSRFVDYSHSSLVRREDKFAVQADSDTSQAHKYHIPGAHESAHEFPLHTAYR